MAVGNTGGATCGFISHSPELAAIKPPYYIFTKLRSASLSPVTVPAALSLPNQYSYRREYGERGSMRLASGSLPIQNRLSRMALHALHATGSNSDGAKLENCRLDKQGIEWHKAILTEEEIDQLNASVDHALQQSGESISKWRGSSHLDQMIPGIEWLSNDPRILSHLADYISGTPTLIRFTLMEKPVGKHWPVLWHQDDPIHGALKERVVTVRIHLDRTDRSNGCLKVILDSHKNGVMSREVLNQTVESSEPFYCEVDAGDALLMRPLIIHSSEDNVSNQNRRILHLEYVDAEDI